ncbi:NnrS family protein [Rhizobium sp. 18065]|uniref:NnrS family protein n=1 Tax=Rhizobium sp. 18065 TaxID=2681411 RepID=UPI00135C630F|nr:NnrS family protein [Rhizobium sp. 18065]
MDKNTYEKIPREITSQLRGHGTPRGLQQDGPVLLSYGFRPFFLGAGVWAIIAMILWLALLTQDFDFAHRYGQSNWHAHELLFGFATAALVGYLMTTIPNWTGGFPLAGRPLAGLALLWLAGRIALLSVDHLPMLLCLSVDWLFLPIFAFFCAREFRKSRRVLDLKPLAALMLLSAFNAGFHASAATTTDTTFWVRASLSIYVLLITSTSAKLVPSFTNSWLAQSGKKRLEPANRKIDRAVLLSTAVALMIWTAAPHGAMTTIATCIATTCQLIRIKGWFSRFVLGAPLILALQLSYVFIPLGLFGVAAASLGVMPDHAGLHLLGIGAVAGMILAIMNRSIRLHIGRSERGAVALLLSSPCLLLAGLIRVAADLLPESYFLLIVAAGLLWIAGFTLFLINAAPLLTRVRRQSNRQAPPPIRMNMR